MGPSHSLRWLTQGRGQERVLPRCPLGTQPGPSPVGRRGPAPTPSPTGLTRPTTPQPWLIPPGHPSARSSAGCTLPPTFHSELLLVTQRTGPLVSLPVQGAGLSLTPPRARSLPHTCQHLTFLLLFSFACHCPHYHGRCRDQTVRLTPGPRAAPAPVSPWSLLTGHMVALSFPSSYNETATVLRQKGQPGR